MKTITTPHESYQPKQGFGARLLFYAFLLTLIGLSKAFAQVPNAPTAQPASNIACASFDANWDTTTLVTACYIDVSTDANFNSFAGNYNNFNVGNVTTYNVTGLTANTTYYYRVRSSNINGSSLNSNTITVSTTAPIIPTPPTAMPVTNFTCYSFIATWSEVPGVQQYILDVSPDPSFSTFLTGFDSLNVGNDTAFNVVGLVPNVVYFYRVRAWSACATSSNSNTINFNLAVSNAEFTYGVDVFDPNGVDPSPIFTNGGSAGSFLSDSGLVIDPNTGVIDLSASTSGQHYIINIAQSGGCSLTDDDTIYIAPLAGCSAFTYFNDSVGFYTDPCLIDSVSADLSLFYNNLTPGTTTLSINWGDGTVDTYPFSNGSGTGYYYLNSNLHQYSFPGVYTISITTIDPSACYNHTLIQSIVVASNNCGTLYGNVFNDVNTNCTLNSGTDIGVAYQLITATDANNNVYYAWTDYMGRYAFNTLPNGIYTVNLAYPNSVYSITCSGILPATITVNNNSQTLDVPLTCNGSFDVAITGISIWSALYPGQPGTFFPHVGLLNATCNPSPVAGQVKIVLDACTQTTGAWQYSGAGAPDIIISASTGDTLVWDVADINNLGNFSYFDYALNIMMCTTAQVGDSACITMMVLPTNGDANPSNNTYTRCFEIGVSYDPNNKEVMPTGDGAQGFIPADQPSLTYTLNFQNTGTAQAWNIYVMDTIDTDLDINSIEILSASHRVQVYTLPNRAVKFMFANIMLPDSASNELESHGYVTFKVKLNAGLTPGTEIENTGHIYFDYNDPIVTNTTLNTIEFPSSVQSIGKSTVVKVYPNPAKESVTVVSNSNSTGLITITDLLGKTVKEVITTTEKTVVNTADLQSGVYFIKLTQNNITTTEKIMIAK